MISSEDKVLLVGEEPDLSDRIRRRLARAGRTVLVCPGDVPYHAGCPSMSGEPCLFAAEADVVVLDLRLDRDITMDVAPGWQMLLAYVAMGKRVVALADPSDLVGLGTDDPVAALRRDATADEVLDAVRRLEVGERGSRRHSFPA